MNSQLYSNIFNNFKYCTILSRYTSIIYTIKILLNELIFSILSIPFQFVSFQMSVILEISRCSIKQVYLSRRKIIFIVNRVKEQIKLILRLDCYLVYIVKFRFYRWKWLSIKRKCVNRMERNSQYFDIGLFFHSPWRLKINRCYHTRILANTLNLKPIKWWMYSEVHIIKRISSNLLIIYALYALTTPINAHILNLLYIMF